MPAATLWRLVVRSTGVEHAVAFYPDAEDGITATFPHQDYNAPAIAPYPWRRGKPCLDRRAAAFGHDAWQDEPFDRYGRMVWQVQRLLAWVDAAAADELLMKGDALELPPLPGASQFPVVGFNEAMARLDAIPDGMTWGFASTLSVPRSDGLHLITDLRGPDKRVLTTARWGDAIAVKKAAVNAIWIDAGSLPVLPPWQAVDTWRELRDHLALEGTQLGDIFAAAGSKARSTRRGLTPEMLLLGFPLAEKIGGVPGRRHWLAVSKLDLADRKTRRNGFRVNEKNHLQWDRDLVDRPKRVSWLATRNLSSDQLRRRGEAEEAVKRQRTLIIGAGALGSAVADSLIRLGVVNLAVMDGDLLDVGNLCRHVLTIDDVGHNKAIALAAHLNRAAPDARVVPFASQFPPSGAVGRHVRSYDLIIDCTAEDGVLRAMEAFEWRSDKLFVSLGTTWRAEGLFAFATKAQTFPADAVIARYLEFPAPKMDIDDASVEGIGCWSPVFPAGADDIQLWAAVGVGFIRRSVASPTTASTYYVRRDDGSVERLGD